MNPVYANANAIYCEARHIKSNDPARAVELLNNAYDMMYQAGMEKAILCRKITALRVNIQVSMDERAHAVNVKP